MSGSWSDHRSPCTRGSGVKVEFPEPCPELIEEFSPSLANQLMSCPLRAAFSRDPQYHKWKRPSPQTALGNVAHALTEKAFTKHSWPPEETEARAALEKVWDECAQQEAQKLNEAWAPAELPAPQEWPGYALTKFRTIRRALNLVTRERREEPDRVRPAGIGVERFMHDETSGLIGRADRIEPAGNKTRIVDLKTGLNQGEPSQDQQRQLLLYAVLVHRTTGAWPASIAVEDASGEQFELPLNPHDAEQALQDVQDAISQFNNDATVGRSLSSARPSSDNCRWCPFRVVCSPYWSSINQEWEHQAAIGSISDHGRSGEGYFVSVDAAPQLSPASRPIHVSGLAQEIPEDAEHIALVDWTGSPTAEEVRARWNTRVQTW